MLLLAGLLTGSTACAPEKTVAENSASKTVSGAISRSTTALEVSGKDLQDKVRKAYSANKGQSGYFVNGLAGITGISFAQVIKVTGTIDSMYYEEKPNGSQFSIVFKSGGSRSADWITMLFAPNPTMQARQLEAKGLLHKGDEVIIQGKYNGYRSINKGQALAAMLSDCSLVDPAK